MTRPVRSSAGAGPRPVRAAARPARFAEGQVVRQRWRGDE